MHRPSCDSAGQARLLKSNMLVPPVTVAKTDDSDGFFCLDAEVRLHGRIRHGESSPPENSSRALLHARRCQVRVDTSFSKCPIQRGYSRWSTVCWSTDMIRRIICDRDGSPKGQDLKGLGSRQPVRRPEKQKVETKTFLRTVAPPGVSSRACPVPRSKSR